MITKDGKIITVNGKGLNFDSLVAQANEVTGKDDKTVRDAVQSLCDKASRGASLTEILTLLVNQQLTYFKTDMLSRNTAYIYSGMPSAYTYEYTVFFSQRTGGAQLPQYLFYNATLMKYCNAGKCYAITGQQNFFNTRNLKSLVFQKYAGYKTSLANINAFDGSSIQNGTGFVYFPDKDENGNDYPNIIKSLSNWATYASQIRGYSEAPAYDSATTYEIGDVCKYNGRFYGYCKEDLTSSTGNAPSGTTADNAYWEYVGELEV